MDTVFLEAQYFYDNDGNFVIKEIAILSSDGNKYCHYLLKPPFEWINLRRKQQNKALWLKKFYNGLEWSRGYIEYGLCSTVINDICENYTNIYSKGRRKCNYLTEFLNRSVKNIEDLECPPLRKLKDMNYRTIRCFNHASHRLNCASENVHLIQNWYNEHIRIGILSDEDPILRMSFRCLCIG